MLAELWAAVQSDWQVLALSSAAIFLAAIVRGFSGFGFSLLSITAIALILPVKQIVPSIFLLEIAASINLLPGIGRASIIFFFLFTDTLGVGYFTTQEDMVTLRTFIQAVAWLPALLIGVWIGAHGFRRMNEQVFRRWVLVILIALALLGIGKAV